MVHLPSTSTRDCRLLSNRNLWKIALKNNAAWRDDAAKKSGDVKTNAVQTEFTKIDAIGTGSIGIDNIPIDCTNNVGSMSVVMNNADLMNVAKNKDVKNNARLTDAKMRDVKTNGVIMIGAVDK